MEAVNGASARLGPARHLAEHAPRSYAVPNLHFSLSGAQALPTPAWFQIIAFISICEVNFLKQDPNKAPGDVVPDDWAWARYPDGYDVWLGDGE